MDASLIRQVWERARGRCEYCRIGQEFEKATYEIDHIISRKHDGLTVSENLALSCPHCNAFKGSDISGLDPKTRKLTPLFHPRRQKWTRHFRWEGPYLAGRTASGRVTVAVLKINDPFRVELREELIEEGVFPPH
jgi:HNH endonuclease